MSIKRVFGRVMVLIVYLSASSYAACGTSEQHEEERKGGFSAKCENWECYHDKPHVVLKFDAEYTKKLDTYFWGGNTDALVPSDPEKVYMLRFILSGFSLSGIHNVCIFLKKLAERGGADDLLIESVWLENMTSQKFNKLKDGLSAFVAKFPCTMIAYLHTGKPTPKAATTTFQNFMFSSAGKRKCYMPQQDILVLGPEGKTDKAEYKMDPVLVEDKITDEVVNRMEKLVLNQEREDVLDQLRKRWLRLKLGDWPPFGLDHIRQVKQLHADDLQEEISVKAESSGYEEIVSLLISGATGSAISEIADLCQQQKSIKFLCVSESSCGIKSLTRLTPAIEHGGLEIIDVRQATSEPGDDLYTTLEKRLKNIGKPEFISRFVTHDPAEYNISLTDEQRARFKAACVLEDYINHLRISSEDDGVSSCSKI